jgi:hypothetical protein
MKLKYKNTLFNTLKNSAFGVENFLFEDNASDDPDSVLKTSKISFLENGNKSNFSFMIRESNEQFNNFDCKYTLYTPTFPYSSYYPPVDWLNIEGICEQIQRWLFNEITPYVQDNKDEIDLWEEYLKSGTFEQTRQINFNDIADFTYDEKQQILIALQNLNLSINQNFNVSHEQAKLVNDGIKYLSEGVDRLNKLDWKSILIGQFFTIATTLATNPEQFQSLYHMFLKVIQIIYVLPK